MKEGAEDHGIESALPTEEYYLNSHSIYQALEGDPVLLCRGSWLRDLAKDRGILPRRQELQESAAWNRHDLFRAIDGGRFKLRRKLVAVSYCWLTASHPDPRGQQLELLGKLSDKLLQVPDFFGEVGDHCDAKKPGGDGKTTPHASHTRTRIPIPVAQIF